MPVCIFRLMAKDEKPMQRYSLFLTTVQLEKLEERRQRVGVPVATAIRQAVDAYLVHSELVDRRMEKVLKQLEERTK